MEADSTPRTPSLRRVVSENTLSTTVASSVDALGTGTYQLIVLCAIGASSLSESIEMGAIAPLSTALAREYNFDSQSRSSLPFAAIVGSAVGLLFTGLFADQCGRKSAIIASQALIVVTMIATALLHSQASFTYILALRFVAGFAAAVQGPAGIALAVESCPREFRAQITFRIAAFSSLGYVVEALMVLILMPTFGEADSDHWRVLCFVTAAVAGCALPPLFLLYESPRFLAVIGNTRRCMEALDGIARWNGRPLAPRMFTAGAGASSTVLEAFSGWISGIKSAVWCCGTLILILVFVDGLRTFFISGFSYLVKDLVLLSDQDGLLGPAELYLWTAFAPLAGLFLGERIVQRGHDITRVMFWTSLLAAASLIVLMNDYVRTSAWHLLLLVAGVKLTYGVLGACCTLLKIRAFPTKIRVTTFSFISILSKVFAAFAPTMLESMKGSEEAASWENTPLSCYIGLLAGCALCSGTLALTCPDGDHDAAEQEEGADGNKVRAYGSTS